MTNPDIAMRRMFSQQISTSSPRTPAEIVSWLGAVQSQDYGGAKWAIGLRAQAGNAALEQAINDGSILRLHVMRPTWHFVAAEDVRWLLALTADRVKAGMAARLRELEIDAAVIARSQQIFHQSLSGGLQMTRAELEIALNQGGISTAIPQRMNHLLMQAELDRVLINGSWKGKQATYALFEERVPAAGAESRHLLEPAAAAAELARRYFTSHGPAALKDFTWWSGLKVSDARVGIDAVRDRLEREIIDGQEYWRAKEGTVQSTDPTPGPVAHLLPNYDEYVVAYTDRSAIFDPAHADRLHLRGGVLNNVVIIDGLVAGSWKRELKKQTVLVTVEPLWALSQDQQQAVAQAARRYADFMGLAANLELR
jgi:hypothetical protein